jgi:hypothetical protein
MKHTSLALFAIVTLLSLYFLSVHPSTAASLSCSTQMGKTSGFMTTISESVKAGDTISASQLPTLQPVLITWPGGSHFQGHGSASGTSPTAGTAHVRFTNVLSPWPYSITVCTTATSTSTNNVPGPAIPDGFVLRTIKCTVAIYNTPAGTPVGTNKVLAGQTWYINPKPIRGKNGKRWTELFTGGWTNGYIPTSCVGGKPAGYMGA